MPTRKYRGTLRRDAAHYENSHISNLGRIPSRTRKKGLFQTESVTKRTFKAAGRKTRTRASSLPRDRLSVALHTASSNHFGTISGQGDGGREGEREEGRSNAQDRKTGCLPSIWRARGGRTLLISRRARASVVCDVPLPSRWIQDRLTNVARQDFPSEK